MVKTFLREYWPIVVGGSAGLSVSAYALQQATGLPLFPDLSAALSYSAMVIALVGKAVLWTVALLLSLALLYAISVPLKAILLRYSWQQRNPRLARVAVERPTATEERPIVYRDAATDIALKSALSKASNLETLLGSLSENLSQLCYQVTGQHEEDAARAVRVLQAGYSEMADAIFELERQLKERSQVTPQQPQKGLNWRDALALMEWARTRERVGMRATRDLLRGRGVVIHEHEITDFSLSVAKMAPLPHRKEGVQESRPQRENMTDGRLRTPPRTGTRKLPRGGKR